MKLLTKDTLSTARCFEFGEDGKVWARMLTATENAKIRAETRTESKGNDDAADMIYKVKYIKAAVTGWEGFFDIDGNTIPYSENIIADLYEANPVVMSSVFTSVSNEFLHIVLAQEKNSEAGAAA